MKTLLDLFEESVDTYTHNPFMWEKSNGKYTPTSYAQTQKEVMRMAAGLMSIGVQQGDRIALLSEGRNDWVISELAVLYAGAINVPLSIKLEAKTELHFRLAHSESRILLVSGQHAEKARVVKKNLPGLEKIIY